MTPEPITIHPEQEAIITWIPVENEKPEYTMDVLVYSNGMVLIGKYYPSVGTWIINSEHHNYPVTHWAAFPRGPSK